MKRTIIFVGQLAFTFGLSVGVFWLLPPDIYLMVGGLAALITFGLMISVEAEYLEITPGYVASSIFVALLFGALFPALPPIVVWGNVSKRSKAHDAKSSSAGDASGPRGPCS